MSLSNQSEIFLNRQMHSDQTIKASVVTEKIRLPINNGNKMLK